MSDLDTLVVTFQTQLSDVMETVVKTAMYEVTRLVEDGFLEEVKRRNQEVESLRMQLQWAERKLGDKGGKEGGKTGKCVNCGMDDVELSSDSAGERPPEEQQDGKKNETYLFRYKTLCVMLYYLSTSVSDILRGCGVKKEGDSVERWTRSCRQEAIPESTQTADNPTATHSPERKSQVGHMTASEQSYSVSDARSVLF